MTGNHRADSSGSRRGTSVTSHDASASGSDIAVAPPYVGRRVADRPVDAPSTELRIESGVVDTGMVAQILADLEPVDQSTSFVDDETETFPMLQAAPPGGRRKATKRTGARGPLRRLPSVPVLLGIAALAVSVGGAVTVGDPQLAGSTSGGGGNRVTQATALSGSGGVSRISARSESVSRDSSRQAAASAQEKNLRAAAEKDAVQRNTKLKGLANAAQAQSDKIKANQWVLPVVGYHLTARFGQSSGLWANLHTGLDFAAPSGTPIMAVANGTVTSTGYDGSYGNKTVITLEDGTELWFCHQTTFEVSVGDTVRAGQEIGTVGATGNVTGPHLHLEVRPGGGDPVDPFTALEAQGLHP